MSTPAAQYLESALKCHERGDYANAEQFYQQALAVEPHNVDVVHTSGILALQANNFPLATARLRRAIELGVTLPSTHLLLGRALKAQGDIEGAISSYQRAIKSAPGMSAAYISLGIALKEQGRLSEAAASYREALLLNPSSFEARINLANALHLQGQLDEALAEYQKAAELQPDSPQVQYNIGIVLRAQRRDAEAAERFQQAVLLDPDYLEAYYNLANTLTTIGLYPAAIDCFRHLHTLLDTGAGRLADPAARERLKQDALIGSAAPLVWSHRYDEAMPIVVDALARDPDSVLFNEYYLVMLPFRCANREEILEAYARYQRITYFRDAKPLASAPHYDASSKLRIGYMSGDLRDHSIAFFMEPILANHDRQLFEIAIYSTNREDDEVTERLKNYVDLWVNAKDLDDTALAQRIADDQVDILVDLSGRTLQNRLGVIVKRPALLQIGYLGYPTYTGVPQLAYRLTDGVIDPEGEEGLASEQPLRLPHTMFCYRPPLDDPRPTRNGITKQGGICFGSFNQVQKLSPATLTAWARILKAVPGSRLLLKTAAFKENEIRQGLTDAFARHGIAAERIMLREGTPQRHDHLAMYGEIDIALDTFPYNGATTTCEALWMEVPVLTLRGETHPSRMGASILAALGLQELIANSIEQYIDIAIGLAGDAKRLADLRGSLRQRMKNSPLCDEQRFTRDFEGALRTAWRQTGHPV